MASMRDIKRRVKSVNSTQQITKAMNLVASSKLNKAKSRMKDTRPFFNQIQEVITDVVGGSKGFSHPFIKEREVKNTAIFVVTGDRGLCGGYNINVCKEAMNVAKDKKNVSYVTLGAKAREYFKHRQGNIVKSYRGFSENPRYQEALMIGEKALEMFSSGEVDEVYLVYTEFITTISSEPKAIKILPIDTSKLKVAEGDSTTLTIYEPDEETVLEYVIPKYVNTLIFGALVESAACELGARMTAMDAATENASEMIDDLNLLYNRIRQGAITQEITEIVSGSNALE